jgi:hypothetical protein
MSRNGTIDTYWDSVQLRLNTDCLNNPRSGNPELAANMLPIASICHEAQFL